jgi:RHS repeat-associated protein
MSAGRRLAHRVNSGTQKIDCGQPPRCLVLTTGSGEAIEGLKTRRLSALWRLSLASIVSLVAPIVLLSSPIRGITVTTAAAAPATPFIQCPAVGLSPSCGVLLVVNSDRTVSVFNDSNVGPFDSTNGDDTLIGIENDSSQPVTAITALGPAGLFAFDGDGLCGAAISPKPNGCPFGSYGYEGPTTRIVTDPGSQADGEVDFAGTGLAPQAHTFFSLETAVTSATLTVRQGAGPTSSELLGGFNPSEKPCSCNSTHNPVNDATGDFFHTFTDISIPGRGLPLNFQRTYNSLSASQNGPFGYGWTSSYGSRLTVDASGNVVIAQENGSTVSFTNFGGSYTPPTRVLATLVKNGDGTYTFKRQDQTKYQFSASGQLIAESDRNGYTTTLSYTGGLLTGITDPGGRSLTLTYTGGLVTGLASSTGRSVSYQYDGSANLQQLRDVNGGLTNFTYNPDHTMSAMTGPAGSLVQNFYDGSGRVIGQDVYYQKITVFDYSTPGQTKITDPKGNVTVEVYTNNLLMSRTRGYGTAQAATWQYAYDSATLGVTSITDPNSNTVRNTWDSNGNLLTHTDGLHPPTIYTYDSLNDVKTVKDPLGVTTTNTYDAAGNLRQVSTRLVGTPFYKVTNYTYGDASHPGDVTVMTDPDQKPWQYGYDSYGDKNSVIDPLGDQTAYGFNNDGWVMWKVTPKGKVPGGNPFAYMTQYDYTDRRTGHLNGFGDVGLVQDPLNRTTTYTYDANRNLTFTTDANGHTTQTKYDADNEPYEVDRADGSKTQTQYYPDGAIYAQIDGKGNTTLYNYDPLGHLSSVQDPLHRTNTYVYDAVGNLVFVNNGGHYASYGYDAANELTAITYFDGTPNVGPIHYDADGQRQDMTDGTGTTTYTFDSLHRLTQQTNGAGSQVKYGYDLRGHVNSITYPGGTNQVSRTYDDAGRLHTVSDWLPAHNTTQFDYDPNGNLVTITYPNQIKALYGDVVNHQYDAADQLPGIVDTQVVNGVTSTFASYSYSRDQVGQLTGDGTSTYNNDPVNRLTTVNGNTTAYGYDAADEVTKTPSLSTTPTSYDAANQLVSGTLNGFPMTAGYDARGNRSSTTIGGSTTTAGFDQANRMVSFTGNGTTTSYSYNGDGLRMKKGSAQFAWDVADGIPLLLQDSAASYITGPGGLVIEQVNSAQQAYFLHQDQLGSTRWISDIAGNVLGLFNYDPYGKLTVGYSTVLTPFRFAGQYLDSESGLYYLRARYYDPQTAQFISRDTLTSTTRQPYSYVFDNPLNRTDDTGLCSVGPANLPIWGSGPCITPPTRLPDYVTLQVQIPIGALVDFPFAGVQVGATYDRYGHGYVDAGVAGGFPAAAGFNVNAGYINALCSSEAQIGQYISGPTLTAGGYYWVGGQGVWGNIGRLNKNDVGYELGVGNPEATASATWNWQVGPRGPLQWH